MTSSFKPVKKGTVLIPTGPTDHLHFICSDPVYYPAVGKDSVLLVNISSISPNVPHDQSCILNPGDHPFVKHPSFVYYRKADIYGADSVSRNVDEGNFSVHQPCDDIVFGRILSGFEATSEIPYKIRRFYENFCKTQK